VVHCSGFSSEPVFEAQFTAGPTVHTAKSNLKCALENLELNIGCPESILPFVEALKTRT
jgi:hypothetical protein